MGEGAILVEELSKAFPPPPLARLGGKRPGPTQALRQVSFAAQPGEVTALIGPNGSGKSTLLRILSGVLLPTSGTARVCGLDVAADRPRSRAGVGLAASEDRGLSPRLSIRENVRFFGALYGLSAAETAARTSALAARLECADLLDRPVRTLSSGQRARAALMRALLHQPRVLLLDELTRALDPGAGRRIRGWLKEEAARAQLSVVLATHDLGEVESVADRVLVLERGALAAHGSWAEVRPAAEAIFAREGEA